MVTAVYLASLAWAGHAAAGQGSERLIQIISDVVHLLAGGAWLGALPGLVFLLGSAPAMDVTAQAARRFSIVGMVSVGALILSGFINTWFLVGSVPALVGTGYGQLLLAKLTLVVLMVSLAAVNRLRLTPRLHGRDRESQRLLLAQCDPGNRCRTRRGGYCRSARSFRSGSTSVCAVAVPSHLELGAGGEFSRSSLGAGGCGCACVHRRRFRRPRGAQSAATTLGRRNRRHRRRSCRRRAAARSAGGSDHLCQVAGALHDSRDRSRLRTVR